MMFYGVFLNYILAFFNLIPVPPLDGSHIFYHLLPPAQGARYRPLGRYGFGAAGDVHGAGLPSVGNVLLWPADQAIRATLSAVGGFALPAAIRDGDRRVRHGHAGAAGRRGGRGRDAGRAGPRRRLQSSRWSATPGRSTSSCR